MAIDFRLDNGRLLLNDGGDVELVSGTDKLIQSILNELTLPLGSDIFNPNRGSALNSDLIGTVLDPSVLLPRLQAEILRTLNMFQQTQQRQAMKQFFSDAEMLVEVLDVNLTIDPSDPRQIDIAIDVISGALTPITISFTWQAF